MAAPGVKAAWIAILLVAPAAASGGDALQFLADRDAGGPYVVEALIAADIDPARWPDDRHSVLHRLTIPAGDDAVTGLRALHAAALLGPSFDDAVRGRLDIAVELDAKLPAVLASPNDSAAAFLILANHALDNVIPEPLIDHLLELQRNGTWTCGGAGGLECHSYAVVALHAAQRLENPAAAHSFVLDQAVNERFGDAGCPGGNTQMTVWAIHAMAATGEVPDWAWARLLENQMPDGGFCFAGRSDVWATAEAATVLHARFPLAPLARTADESAAGFGAVALLLGLVAKGALHRRRR